ncbi:FUSC family protein [Candidatus Saccharibacteria bacterium]|nr:FUSC family protein [Candidatus Saccharibacteria bacterium]
MATTTQDSSPLDLLRWTKPLMWDEGVRAFLCLIPMFIASFTGHTNYVVTLGQGAFFYAALFLPKRTGGRLIMAALILSVGLGLYLVGGVVAPNPWLAVFFTVIVCLSLSFLSGWKLGGPLALTFVMIYTAGLNTGSPTKASANFVLFALVLTWSAIVSLLPFWTPIPPPAVSTELGNGEYAEQGFRMGIGSGIALAVSYLAGFAKLGWAPSAVGNVVRYDPKMSKLRAWVRFAGTIGGALLATIALVFFHSVTAVVWAGAFFAVVNGIFKKTKFGMMPLFYTATILLLYSATNIAGSTETTLQRVAYNIVGITIGMLVVLYPFPVIMRRLRLMPTGTDAD